MLVGLFFGLLFIIGTGPAASMIDASTIGATTPVVDEQAVELAATRMVRRRSAIRLLRRTPFAAQALQTIQTSRLQSRLTHRWAPSRQLPPPLWRGPPLLAL